MARNNHYLKLYPLKKVTCCRFSVVVGRERLRVESGKKVGYRNIPCIFVQVPWLKVRREVCGTCVCYCWMM